MKFHNFDPYEKDREAPIEKVARAIRARVPAGYGMTEAESMDYARAAIETLVAPTEEMVLAGWDQLSREPSPHAAEACWQAMIAVALQQKQEG